MKPTGVMLIIAVVMISIAAASVAWNEFSHEEEVATELAIERNSKEMDHVANKNLSEILKLNHKEIAEIRQGDIVITEDVGKREYDERKAAYRDAVALLVKIDLIPRMLLLCGFIVCCIIIIELVW